MVYRVFGSHAALATHQISLYLRQRSMPHQLYIYNFLYTRLMGWWYGSETFFCTVNPEGKTLYSFVELFRDVEQRYITNPSPTTAHTDHTQCFHFTVPTVLEDGHTYVLLHWALAVYANWWLMLIGGALRWVSMEGSTGQVRHSAYFITLPRGPMAHAAARSARLHMRTMLASYGATERTLPYIKMHFDEFLERLEDHLTLSPFLLGPKPTLADVMVGAMFASHFMEDDPPANRVRNYTNIQRWLERVTFPNEDKDALRPQDTDALIENIPQTLEPIIELMADVLPSMAAQCDAFHTDVKGGDYKGRLVSGVHWSLRILDVEATECHSCEVSIPHVQFAQFAAEHLQGVVSEVSGQSIVGWEHQSELKRFGEPAMQVLDSMRRIRMATKDATIECVSKGMNEAFVVRK
eukprot:PhF_6_TR43503/c0_g1_i1/m.66783